MRPSDASSLNKDNIPPSSFPFHVSQCSLIPISGASASGTAFIIFPSLTAEFFPPLLSHFILPKGSVLPFISWHFTSVDGNDTNGMWLRLYHRNAVCPAQANLQIIPQERNTPWMQVWELQKKKKQTKNTGGKKTRCWWCTGLYLAVTPAMAMASCLKAMPVKWLWRTVGAVLEALGLLLLVSSKDFWDEGLFHQTCQTKDTGQQLFAFPEYENLCVTTEGKALLRPFSSQC